MASSKETGEGQMNAVNNTMYIPLYGRSLVSRKGIILKDSKAEEIWRKELFPLKGKSKSKWLAYYMAMRARVFDDRIRQKLLECPSSLVLHIGCGMDSRVLRINSAGCMWIDVDFPQVISERRKYYAENKNYKMLDADVSNPDWILQLPDSGCAIVILEGISMYLTNFQVAHLFRALDSKYNHLHILMDVYTEFGAKASKYKSPINDVGITNVYGIDSPEEVLDNSGIMFLKEHDMTPEHLVRELKGFERVFFRIMFAGRVAKKIYRLYEYKKNAENKGL